MTTLYQVDQFGYFTGVVTQINDRGGYIRGAGGWFEVPLPSLSAGEFAVVNGNDWRVTTQPSPPIPPEEPPPTPVTVAEVPYGETPTVI